MTARHSSTAIRPKHAFARCRRLLELFAARLIVVRMLEDVHDAMDEAHAHPIRNERGLALRDGFE
jgi:hypothetical protein